MKSRLLTDGEVSLLRGCLQELADYHNQVSLYHKGVYPTQSLEEVLEEFAGELKSGSAQILLLENETEPAGFCKIHRDREMGELDYLLVRETYRGQGYGRLLMDWAMERFRQMGVRRIAVKVIAGNEARKLYESYGFQLNSYILWREEE